MPDVTNPRARITDCPHDHGWSDHTGSWCKDCGLHLSSVPLNSFPAAPVADGESLELELLNPRELGPKDWGEELLLAHTPHYTLKRLTMRKGASGPLQHHVEKYETFVVHSGLVDVTYQLGDALVCDRCGPGEGATIPPGVPHKVAAREDTVMYEASNPIFDDRIDDSDLLNENA